MTGAPGGSSAGEVLCVGEVLWDSLPAGLFLGGAPLNVACHLAALGVRTAMASRVGADRLGREAVARIAAHGVATGLIQRDATLETGFVAVRLDDGGAASYQIVGPVAWDALRLTDELVTAAERAEAIVFGCLGQRSAESRETIRRLCASPALKVLDPNLRPPHTPPALVRESLELADLVKLNEDELGELARWFGFPAESRPGAAALAARFGCRLVCVTRGRRGAALWHRGRWSEHPGFRVRVRDTVGAGDAFLAALLAGLLEGADDVELLERATRRGADVAARPGAVPAAF
jgi:fructokinase